jgi:hypothetical protein
MAQAGRSLAGWKDGLVGGKLGGKKIQIFGLSIIDNFFICETFHKLFGQKKLAHFLIVCQFSNFTDKFSSVQFSQFHGQKLALPPTSQ